MSARLHAVTHPRQITAADALAWFIEEAAGRSVTGYLYAPADALWFRCHGPVPHGPGAERDLTPVFEIFATDGSRQLRWIHRTSGTGEAITLAEDPGLLPPGTAMTTVPVRTRLGGVATRMLAGLVLESHDGWASLASARYAPCDVPVSASRGQEVWADLAEYSVTDEHGNVSVTDTLLLGLQARDPGPSRATGSQA